MPPSTTSIVPVMKRAAGEARKPTTSATSSGSPQRPERRVRADPVVALVDLRRGRHGRADQPGRDGVDADAARAELDRQRLGQRAQRCLRGGVDRRRRARHREHGDGLDRGDADHGAARRHAPGEALQQEEGRTGIDRDHAFPVLEPDLRERQSLDDAGAVDEHVDARAGRAHGGERRLDVEQIGRHVRTRLRGRRRRDVDGHDLEAVAGQALDAGAPDAARASGDDCYGHALPFVTIVWSSLTAMPHPPQRFDAIIVGAGFSGLYLLHRLRELGLSVRRARRRRPASAARGTGTATPARAATSRA